LITLVATANDYGPTGKLRIDDNPIWTQAWGRLSSDTAYIYNNQSPDDKLLNNADLVVFYLYDRLLTEEDMFYDFQHALLQCRCPVIFEWAYILEEASTNYERMFTHMAPFLNSVNLTMYDFYHEPKHAGLRSHFMPKCEPLWLSNMYFDRVFWQREILAHDNERDGRIIVLDTTHVTDGLWQHRYWSHKYANDIATLRNTTFLAHNLPEGAPSPFERHEVMPYLKWRDFVELLLTVSMAVNLDTRPWMGRAGLDVAAAKIPYLCASDPIVPRKLWKDVAVDDIFDYESTLQRGLDLYDGKFGAYVDLARIQLNRMNVGANKLEIREKLGIDF